MPSTYSPNRDYQLQANGEDIGIWGTNFNANLSMIDVNFGGRLNLSVAGSSDVNVNSTQAQSRVHVLSGVLTGNINYILPKQGNIYFIANGTTGSYTLTVKCLGGSTGIKIAQGSTLMVFVNPDDLTVNYGCGANVVVDRQVYSAAGIYTWTKPAALNSRAMVFVQVWGGGGSGGTASVFAGGGGGGSYKEAWFLASSLTSTVNVTVGMGGTAAGGNPNVGSNGGNSYFGASEGNGNNYLEGYGGGGGAASNSSNVSGGYAGGWLQTATTSGGGSNDVPTGEGQGTSVNLTSTPGYFVGGAGGATATFIGSASQQGQNSVFGGAGGGSIYNASGPGAGGGTSYYGVRAFPPYGGNGGTSVASGLGTDGFVPGGGGGACGGTGASGAGGDGAIIVTCFQG